MPKLAKLLNVFTIADATNGLKGQGPLALGEPAFLNYVFAGKSPASLDVIFCEATMLKIPHYVSSSLAIDSVNIEVVGNELEALKYSIEPANPNETPHPDIKVIDGKACPACVNLLYGLSSKLVGLRGQEMNLVIGSCILSSELEGKNRLVALGDCAIKRLNELDIDMAKIDEKLDNVEQLVLLKKLLETEGKPKITPVDKVKSKMKKLLSKVVR